MCFSCLTPCAASRISLPCLAGYRKSSQIDYIHNICISTCDLMCGAHRPCHGPARMFLCILFRVHFLEFHSSLQVRVCAPLALPWPWLGHTPWLPLGMDDQSMRFLTKIRHDLLCGKYVRSPYAFTPSSTTNGPELNVPLEYIYGLRLKLGHEM